MLETLLRDAQILHKADLLIGKIWLQVLLRRFGLALFAGLIAVFALGMLNLAAFLGLQPGLNAMQAAAAVAAADIVLAVLALLFALQAKPGPEIELAQQMRAMAVERLQQDAAGLKESATQLMHNPLDAAASKVLLPAALSLLRHLRSRKPSA